jgi:hypothetical protein
MLKYGLDLLQEYPKNFATMAFIALSNFAALTLCAG